MNQNKNLDNELKNLTYKSYDYKNRTQLSSDWNMVGHQKTISGFEGYIYQKGNDIVVVYNGTNGLIDYFSDFNMAQGRKPFQTKAALDLYAQAKVMFPNYNITVSGHSLGGSLAQIVSAYTGASAVTFNAYGTADILAKAGFNNPYSLNIKNYGNPEDPIFTRNITKQPGRTFVTNTSLNPDSIYGIIHSNNNIMDINEHYTENLGNLSDAVMVFPNNNINFNLLDIKNATRNTNHTLQGRVSNDNIWRNIIGRFSPKPTGFAAPITDNFGSEHIFTPDEIGNLSPEKFNQYESQIMKQVKDGLINSELDRNYAGYKNSVSGNSKIFSREDIGQMSTDEYSENEAAIFAQMNSIGIPTNTEISHAGGVIYVEPYFRSDGTPVRGYYRSV